MNWKQEAVTAWRELFNDKSGEAKLIPVYEQVGKILEFTLLDEAEAESYILQQLREDRRGTLLDDGYWSEVLTKFQELKINELIMAE